ncbi:MAG: transglycosylase SLT domain-containing protein [bacterium]|nr:transglycosylase SLT domain-containing protein [bacterium]
MNRITKLINKLHAPGQLFAMGAILFSLFQVQVTPEALKSVWPLSVAVKAAPVATASVIAGQIEIIEETSLTDIFFGKDASLKSTRNTIDKKIEFVSTRKAYPASLAVIQKHEDTIRSKARKYGVPEDVAIGVGLLENGGSDTAKSPAGALGVFQLMPGTARSLGLTVNKKIDERRNPEKNIDAGMRYLALNYYRFGDWGLATWAYHAGEGNVAKAVQLYAKANHNVSLPGVKDPSAARSYIKKYGLTIHKLLSSPAVKALTKKLNDDSSGYPYKVVATATLFKKAGSQALLEKPKKKL